MEQPIALDQMGLIGSGNRRIYHPMAISHNNGYLYVASYYTRRIFRIRISDVYVIGMFPFHILDPYQ